MSDCGCHENYVCDYCDEAFNRYRQIIMGWAFDAGMLEAERDRARAFYERMFTRDIAQREEIAAIPAAIAAERARCLAWVRASGFWETAAKRIESGADAPTGPVREVRDEEDSCASFKTQPGGPRDCTGDGHYRCHECCYFQEKP